MTDPLSVMLFSILVFGLVYYGASKLLRFKTLKSILSDPKFIQKWAHSDCHTSSIPEPEIRLVVKDSTEVLVPVVQPIEVKEESVNWQQHIESLRPVVNNTTKAQQVLNTVWDRR